MKAVPALFLVLFGVLPPARSEIIEVNARTLRDWTVEGDQPAFSGNVLILQGDGGITRFFATTDLTVRLTTRPIFGTKPEDYPIVAIDSAALAFVRDGEKGLVVFVTGEDERQVLSEKIQLDADGRALAPVVIEFSRQGNVISVSHADEVLEAVSAPVDGSSEVIAFSGESQAWAIDRFSVEVSDKTVTPPGAATNEAERSAPKEALRERLASLEQDAADQGKHTRSGTVLGTGPSKPTETAEASSLEIFTPPAVRPNRTEIANAAIKAQPR